MNPRVVWNDLDVKEERLRELVSWLAPDERERAGRFVFELHRRRFAAARGLLRETLAEELRLSPAAVRFESGAHGKPRLGPGHEPGLRFNLSHSGAQLVIATARGMELGVDVEALREEVEHAAIARRFFSEAEQLALRGEPAPRRAAAFFAIWTRKEAYVKLLGGGLRIPLDSFDVSLGEPPRLLRGAPPGVELLRLEPPPGFAAALAVAPPDAISQAR